MTHIWGDYSLDLNMTHIWGDYSLDHSDFTVDEFWAQVQSILSRVMPILYTQRESMQEGILLG